MQVIVSFSDKETEKLYRNRMRTINLIHPGEILREEFLLPLGIAQNRLAIMLRLPATRIGDIVKEKCGISADTALRLGKYFGTGAEFWMNPIKNKPRSLRL